LNLTWFLILGISLASWWEFLGPGKEVIP